MLFPFPAYSVSEELIHVMHISEDDWIFSLVISQNFLAPIGVAIVLSIQNICFMCEKSGLKNREAFLKSLFFLCCSAASCVFSKQDVLL